MIRKEEKDVSSFLKLISGGEQLILDATDGTDVLADKRMFADGIDADLRDWGPNKNVSPTKKTAVQVYEKIEDKTLDHVFRSLAMDPSFIQAQIKNFVKKYPSWLAPFGGATLFPLEFNGKFFIIGVRVNPHGRLGVGFCQTGGWPGDRRNYECPSRVILPLVMEPGD